MTIQTLVSPPIAPKPTQKRPVLRVAMAHSQEDVKAAQRLRFEVFNRELGEGLPESEATGLDADPFDPVCDHLMIWDQKTAIATYRMQTGRTAKAGRGYYSEQEFDFAPFEFVRKESVELGRACIHRDYRSMYVLGLLWKGIANYAKEHDARYLCGCSSLTSQLPEEGAAVYAKLAEKHLAPLEFRTMPLPAYACPMDQMGSATPKVPKLLRGYLDIGAWICGPPAIDRKFKTIDFLTLLDLEVLPPTAKKHFFGEPLV